MSDHDPDDRQPTVYSAIVSTELLDDLFADIDASAQHLQVRIKDRETGLSSDSPVSLAEAKAAVIKGASAQMRYQFQGQTWSDTLQWTPEGIRLVRCPI